MIMTNLGVVDPATTLGTVTGDLRGSVAATILSTEGTGNTLILHVQHHWVTESGDTLDFDPATATTTQVAPGLYAIVTYPFISKAERVSTPKRRAISPTSAKRT